MTVIKLTDLLDLRFFFLIQMLNYDDETGRIYENDWFNLNTFDESFDGRAFSPEECSDFLFDLSVSGSQKIYRNEFPRAIRSFIYM